MGCMPAWLHAHPCGQASPIAEVCLHSYATHTILRSQGYCTLPQLYCPMDGVLQANCRHVSCVPMAIEQGKLFGTK